MYLEMRAVLLGWGSGCAASQILIIHVSLWSITSLAYTRSLGKWVDNALFFASWLYNPLEPDADPYSYNE